MRQMKEGNIRAIQLFVPLVDNEILNERCAYNYSLAVDSPPCSLQRLRPLMAGFLHVPPLRVRAPHRRPGQLCAKPDLSVARPAMVASSGEPD